MAALIAHDRAGESGPEPAEQLPGTSTRPLPGGRDGMSSLTRGRVSDRRRHPGKKFFLGGPQAGLLLGDADLVDRLRRHPLARALRVDKLTLAALEATVEQLRGLDTVRRVVGVMRVEGDEQP